MRSPGSPLACDANALTAGDWERHRSVTSELKDKAIDAEQTGGGYTLHLPADGRTIRLAAEFVSRERLCCPFLNFQLEVPSGEDRVYLALSGPPGTGELLSQALEIE